jgi:hypothetical protein
MTADAVHRGSDDAASRRASFLALPYPLIDWLLKLPGAQAKVILRVLQRCRWVPTTVDGVDLDTGEALLSLRSEKVWAGIDLGKKLKPNGKVAARRRALRRAVDDGVLALRPARPPATGSGTTGGTGDGTSPTIARVLQYREILFPATAPAAQGAAQGTQRESAPRSGAIPPSPSPPIPPIPPIGSRARESEAAPTPESFRGSGPVSVVGATHAGDGRYPLTASLLDAVRARGFVMEWPRTDATTARLERAIADVGVPTATERVWSVIVADQTLRVAPKPFAGWYVDTVRGDRRTEERKRPRGIYADRWQDRLTREERAQACAELAALHPDLALAPLGCTGDPAIHPVDQIAALNERWRAVAEGRS